MSLRISLLVLIWFSLLTSHYYDLQSACDDLVMEQWKEVILKQPYTDEHKIKVVSEKSGRQLDVGRPN